MELSSTDSSAERKRNLFVLVEPSLLHHTFLLGPARFTALPLSALSYQSGQDGAILPARDYPLYPAKKIPDSHIIHRAECHCLSRHVLTVLRAA